MTERSEDRNRNDADRLGPKELSDISNRMKRRGRGAIVGIIILLALATSFIIVTNNSTNASNRVSDFSARADCRSAYTALLAKPASKRATLNDDVTSLNAALTSQLGAALLNAQAGGTVTPAVVEQFTATKAQLDEARADLSTQLDIVNALPSVDDAVNKGFTFEGRHYPACPTVAGAVS